MFITTNQPLKLFLKIIVEWNNVYHTSLILIYMQNMLMLLDANEFAILSSTNYHSARLIVFTLAIPKLLTWEEDKGRGEAVNSNH